MYPTPPGPRLAYDLDDTYVFVLRNMGNDVTPYEATRSAARALNSDKSSGMFVPGSFWTFNNLPLRYVLIFPTPTRIRGLFVSNRIIRSGTSGGIPYATSASFDASVEVSFDTTNGVDGTWSVLAANVSSPPRAEASDIDAPGYVRAIQPDGTETDSAGRGTLYTNDVGTFFRENQDDQGYGWKEVAGSLTRNVRALRVSLLDISAEGWTSSSGAGTGDVGTLNHLHLYGEPDTGATEDRLEIVDPIDDESPISLSWGDVSAGQVLTQAFKIKNLSPDKAAEVIDVSAVAGSPSTSPAPHLSVEFSTNGTVFSSTLSLSSIAAGDVSGTLYVRLTVPANLVGPWGPRLLLDVGEWV